MTELTDAELIKAIRECDSYLSMAYVADRIAALSAQIEALSKALGKAVQLAEIASDWNLDEVEIDGKMVRTFELGKEFREALNAAKEQP